MWVLREVQLSALNTIRIRLCLLGSLGWRQCPSENIPKELVSEHRVLVVCHAAQVAYPRLALSQGILGPAMQVSVFIGSGRVK